MKTIIKILTAVMAVILFTGSEILADKKEATKTNDGLKATLKVEPEKSMVDLFLTELRNNKPVTEAKVKATITTPKGTVEKELIGMKMEDIFSFMNTLDMSAKGRYSFDILINRSGKKTSFTFTFENR